MSLYTQQRFIFMTLDPVHIGTGGYRLGRVDMSIVREPGTNLPKIPGTSLAGAARSYAHLFYFEEPESGKRDKALEEDKNAPNTDEVQKAEKAKKKKEREAFYYTFGSANDVGGGQAGTVSIGDARLLFFPVASQAGPVWVTTAELVEEVWNLKVDKPTKDSEIVTTLDVTNGHLNLGWLLLEAKKQKKDFQPKTSLTHWEAIKGRIAVVSTKLMTQVVNSNLEVRTSVSIDPQTGAAQEGALFTYEALPRATWLWSDVIEDDYRGGFKAATNNLPESKSKPNSPLDVVRAGFDLIEYLGVGGMGTRGFGRMKIVGTIDVEDKAPQSVEAQPQVEEVVE